MWYLWLMIGMFSGVIITSLIYFSQSTSGTLRIDHSDQDKDVYRLDIKDLDILEKKKRLILYIDNNADLSLK